MQQRQISLERAHGDLRHLLALRHRADRQRFQRSMAGGAAAFGVALVAAFKVLLIKSLLAKVGFALVVGLMFAFPIVTAMLLSVVFVLIAVAAAFAGENVGTPWCGDDDCDMRTKRRRKLDAMITERQAILTPATRTTP
jgi:hypothetical protein